jgi:hypothetical protein
MKKGQKVRPTLIGFAFYIAFDVEKIFGFFKIKSIDMCNLKTNHKNNIDQFKIENDPNKYYYIL